MKKKLQAGAAIAVILLAISCGGGGGSGTPAPVPPSGTTDDDARRAVLADIGEKLILPTLQDVDTRAAALKTAVDALAAAPAGASERTAAQAVWRTAMASVQHAELLQIGPAAAMSEPGGLGLEMQIHAFPQFNACAIHNAAYTDLGVVATSPAERIGMGALEYLLFSDADNPACSPSGVDGQTKRAQYAARVAARIAEVATQLRTAWEPSGGNFLGKFKTAGAASTVPYATPQEALNAISAAIFYFEKTTKDRKIANPAGIAAVGLLDCTKPISCPELLESPYARASGANVQANLQAFREVFTGAGGGLGLNSLMQGIGRSDLVTRFVALLDAAAAGVTAGTTLDMETNVTGIPGRSDCLAASIARAGIPVCAMHGKIDDVTDTLRAEIVTTLNLKIPDSAAGDND